MEDYDQDWLNIYNDTEHSSGQDPLLDDIASCDTTTCDDEEAKGGLLSFSLLIVGYFTFFFVAEIGETEGAAATSVRQAFKTLVISYLLQRLLF